MVSSAVTASLQIIPNFYLVRIRNTIITTAEDSLILISAENGTIFNSTLANLTTMKIFGILIIIKPQHTFSQMVFTTEEVRKTSFIIQTSQYPTNWEIQIFKIFFSLNYILNDRQVNVNHSADRNYLYQRTSHDYIFNYKMEIEDYRDFRLGVNLGNSFYVSNTSLKNNYWLPKANAYFTFLDLFNWYGTDLQFLGAYTHLSAEPEIAKSYSSYTTTLFSAQILLSIFL